MKLPVAGILILMLLVVSGYVGSEPADGADVADGDRSEVRIVSLDPHVNYYEQYLTTMGVTRPAP